ncbi:probable pectinesterase/pectinesterase inhibitor 51 [Rutidosis leptorrhynchoides]|uniref:probable pectinesterase/pectinesterase inhibitor 51 n=1 Tax=Rutidosis leptorrhynchoides TaxID=125765 RepID=UPI003A98DAD4
MALISFIFIYILIIINISPTTISSRPPSTKTAAAPPPSDKILQACKATRNQTLCESSLNNRTHNNPTQTNTLQIIQTALSISRQNLQTAESMINSIKNSSKGNANLTTAVISCIESISNSNYRLKSTADVLTRGRTKIKDARAWTTAVLAYQHGCRSGLKNFNDTKVVVDTVSFLDTLIGYTSNALSMMRAYDVFGDDTASWKKPETERDGFWERGGPGDGGKRLRVPVGLKPNVTVCKGGGGGCNYTTVQQAINGAPNWRFGDRFVIRVMKGVYQETVRVGLEKQNVILLGDGMGKTVITGNLSVGQTGMSTYKSATVGVLGDGFMASNLTIENTAGPNAHQAVAFRSVSDQSVIENCQFLGNQDTVYAHSLRQFYKSCHIEGNVDFIFGDSASIFQDCTILIRPRQVRPEKEENVVTAHGRIDPAESTGFVFHNCLINGTEEYMKLYYSNPEGHRNFLGRPWKEFSRTVFIGCKLEGLIDAQGWMIWQGEFGLNTLYYGEFNNSGNGSNLSGRVKWSNQIPAEHVNVYSIMNFIQSDQWKLAPT